VILKLIPPSKRRSLRGTGLPRLLLFFALVFVCTFPRTTASAQDESNPTDVVSLKLIDALSDSDKRGVVRSVLVMDLTTAEGQWLGFGSWLADQMSSSLGRQGVSTVSVIDRSRLVAAASRLNLSPANELNLRSAIALGKELGANIVITGSYGAVNDDMGVTLSAFPVSEGGKKPITVVGKVPLTDVVLAHLNVTFGSLRPRGGIYVAGAGGVTGPYFLKCPPPSMRPPEVDISGFRRDKPHGDDLILRLIVTADGHAVQTSVVRGVGYGIDAQYVRALENWEFNPSFDFQNKPVSVLLHLGIHIDPDQIDSGGNSTSPAMPNAKSDSHQ
jgi:hypothetical protein